VHGVLELNTLLMKGASYEKKVELLKAMFGDFLRLELKRGKQPEDDLNFRIHWSGDCYDVEYTEALREAMLAYPQLSFWGYTRSFFAVPILADVPNLTWYISADAVNKKEAVELYEQWKDKVSLCYMGEAVPADLKQHKLIACPVDNGKMELANACHKCRLCLKGKNIFFKTK